MSVPKKDVLLSLDARIDLADIALHTQQEWGEEQSILYSTTIETAIARLAYYPEMGQRRDQIFPGCRVQRVERHVLYYRITNGTLEVLRILHQRVDPVRHLRP
jgi:toxin ParE1/3/4